MKRSIRNINRVETKGEIHYVFKIFYWGIIATGSMSGRNG